jgi:hypothetical protein
MCWKKTEFKDNPFDLVEVQLGSNPAAAEYAGTYIKNRDKEEYFKLGTKGFHTLCSIPSADKKRQGWAFKKHFSNYEYLSMSSTDYAIYASPFVNGYGDSALSLVLGVQNDKQTREISIQKAQDKKYKGNNKIAKYFERFKDFLIKPFSKKQEPIAELTTATSHDLFDISNDIAVPTINDTIINNGLYKEGDKKVNIEWSKQAVDGYRLEIFREERGEYNSYLFDLTENSFSFEPQGGNYFFRIKCFNQELEKYTHGPYSESKKFTKLYAGNCKEENITIHFNKYEDKNIYAKIDGTWYGTGHKYGEPRSIVNFPCPVTIEEYDFENNPGYIVTNLGRVAGRIINSIKIEETNKDEINQKYGNIKINESTIISCKNNPS